MGWRPIKNELILHRWRCVCDGRNDPEGIKWNSSVHTVEVSPDWYEDNGTPVCMNCSEDMQYIETLLDCKFDPMRETLVISVREEKQKNDS